MKKPQRKQKPAPPRSPVTGEEGSRVRSLTLQFDLAHGHLNPEGYKPGDPLEDLFEHADGSLETHELISRNYARLGLDFIDLGNHLAAANHQLDHPKMNSVLRKMQKQAKSLPRIIRLHVDAAMHAAPIGLVDNDRDNDRMQELIELWPLSKEYRKACQALKA